MIAMDLFTGKIFYNSWCFLDFFGFFLSLYLEGIPKPGKHRSYFYSKLYRISRNSFAAFGNFKYF
jgi:hypothetical protein